MGNLSRLYGLSEKETYAQAVERLAGLDRNAYGQKAMSIAARVKNEVTAVSNVDVRPGSDMYALSSYISHGLSKMYAAIMASDASDASKVEMANTVKHLEQIAAQFAESINLKRMEQRKREQEMKRCQSTSSDGETRTESEKRSSRSLRGFLGNLSRSIRSAIPGTKAK